MNTESEPKLIAVFHLTDHMKNKSRLSVQRMPDSSMRYHLAKGGGIPESVSNLFPLGKFSFPSFSTLSDSQDIEYVRAGLGDSCRTIERVETPVSPSEDPWHDDSIQFPRLLSELYAVVDLTEEQIMSIADSMDLDPSDIKALFIRAEKVWSEIQPRKK